MLNRTTTVDGAEIERLAAMRANEHQLPKLAQMSKMGWKVLRLRDFPMMAGAGTEIFLGAKTGARATLMRDGSVVR
jgi:hypothetical protein